MEEKTKPSPFSDSEAVLATVARLFAADGELLAVDILSTAKARFDWYSHDNWDGGFDIYQLYLDVPLVLYSKIGEKKVSLEQSILEKIQAVSQGHTSDHVQSVSIILEVKGGKDWRKKAKTWVSGEEIPPQIQGTKISRKTISIHPEIFKIPDSPINENQVAVMMPFKEEFDGTYSAIKKACITVGLKAVRADDIWSNSTFMQDVFDIIYCSRIVIVDFSGRNSNVMYETGIAHTLGRHVIPVTQSIDDVPSDLQHHRALQYLPNYEGFASLAQGLSVRLGTITGREPK